MWKKSFLLVALSLSLFRLPVASAPIYNPDSPFLNMYSDQTARQVGDVITIRMIETLTNKKEDQTKTTKGFTIPSPSGTGFLHFVNTILSGLGTSSSNSDRQFQNSDAFTTTFAARVVKVEPNGNLVISGTHEVAIDNEKRVVTITGIVRPKDVDSTNTVASTQVADLHADVQGVGKSPGIINKILRVLF